MVRIPIESLLNKDDEKATSARVPASYEDNSRGILLPKVPDVPTIGGLPHRRLTTSRNIRLQTQAIGPYGSRKPENGKDYNSKALGSSGSTLSQDLRGDSAQHRAPYNRNLESKPSSAAKPSYSTTKRPAGHELEACCNVLNLSIPQASKALNVRFLAVSPRAPKKVLRSAQERRLMLETDPNIPEIIKEKLGDGDKVEYVAVVCGICSNRLKLAPGRSWFTSNWLQHRARCALKHGIKLEPLPI